MDASSIKKHLKRYSIHSSRVTTIRSAFAASVAPAEKYDPERVTAALRWLRQEPGALTCIYCHESANGWDHLDALIEDARPSGHGHTLDNLAPACASCNSKKRSSSWESWMKLKGRTSREISRIREYKARFSKGRVMLTNPKFTQAEKAELARVQSTIVSAMKRADEIVKAARERGQARAPAKGRGGTVRVTVRT